LIIYCIIWLRETSKAVSLPSYILYNLTTRDLYCCVITILYNIWYLCSLLYWLISTYKSRLKCSIIISHQVFCRNWTPGQLQQAWTNMSENCLLHRHICLSCYTWLFSYFADNSRKHFGFIPDIIGILYHYELSDYLVEYLLQGIFPPKQLWTSIVYGAVNETHSNEWSLHTTRS
jgi:hypothetical protein